MQMEEIELIKQQLKKILSEKRYLHSVGTMKMAGELAKKYGENEKTAMLVGLTHDIAKEFTKEENIKYAKENQIQLDEIELNNPSLMHAKIGAHMVKEKYKFTKNMQNAILYHTVGDVKMDMFAKIIYIADKIEENREYEEVIETRKLAFENIDKAIFVILNHDIQKNIKQNKLIHPNGILFRNEILLKTIY